MSKLTKNSLICWNCKNSKNSQICQIYTNLLNCQNNPNCLKLKKIEKNTVQIDKKGVCVKMENDPKKNEVKFRHFKFSSVVFHSFSVCFKCQIRFKTYGIHHYIKYGPKISLSRGTKKIGKKNVTNCDSCQIYQSSQ